jgi:type I restriction enzyme S subunit
MREDYVTQRPVGALVRKRTERGEDNDPLLSVTQDKGVVLQEEAGRRNISSSDKSNYRRVYPGDIVYNTMRMWQGASARSQHFGIASPAYTVCIPNEDVSSEYLAYAFKLPEHIALFSARSQGITSDVWNLRFEELARIRIYVVNGDANRRRIAEILSTLDEAIEQTEALIAKSQQIKAGLMHDLFTRGVTPDGQLRPSREATPQLYKESPLGWIPKEWDSPMLGLCIGRIDSGWSPNCAPEPAGLDEWGVLKTTAVTWGGYDASENKCLTVGSDPIPSIEVQQDDLLLTRKGPVDRVGVVVHVAATRPRLMFPDTVFRTQVNDTRRISPKFMALALGSPAVQKHWWQRKVGLADAQVNLNHGILRSTPVPIPSLSEQEMLFERAVAINSQLQAMKSEVRKLSVLKHGLMHDLLTGTVRVPLAAPVPEAAHV